MDPVRNPYSPNAGAPPPALVGRDPLIESFSIALQRTLIGRSQKGILPTGLRGAGKTVLLNRFVNDARGLGYAVAQLEAAEPETFVAFLAEQMRLALYELSLAAKVRDGITVALGVLKSFSASFGLTDLSLKLGVDAKLGQGDSGVLGTDLTALFIAVAEAARANGRAVLIAIDELQYVNEEQLSAIFVALHRTTQLSLPLLVVGTGLPQLPAIAGNAKSYAERLFDYPIIGALSRADTFEAIRAPAIAEGADVEDDALERFYELTQGYAYFIQEWAYRVWNAAPRSPITLDDIIASEASVLESLDESFFRVRYDRLTLREKRYLRAMAELGEGPHRSGDVATLLSVKVESLGPLRSGLIKKGMIYSPQHGDTAFTVPLFDAFMRRTEPNFTPK
jgi:hypothetical protein